MFSESHSSWSCIYFIELYLIIYSESVLMQLRSAFVLCLFSRFRTVQTDRLCSQCGANLRKRPTEQLCGTFRSEPGNLDCGYRGWGNPAGETDTITHFTSIMHLYKRFFVTLCSCSVLPAGLLSPAAQCLLRGSHPADESHRAMHL